MTRIKHVTRSRCPKLDKEGLCECEGENCQENVQVCGVGVPSYETSDYETFNVETSFLPTDNRRQNFTTTCLCPPSYLGERCQWTICQHKKLLGKTYCYPGHLQGAYFLPCWPRNRTLNRLAVNAINKKSARGSGI